MINFIISLIILIVLIICYKYNTSCKKYFKRSIFVWALLIILELSLFNVRYFTSRNYEEIKVDDYIVGEGIKEFKDNSLAIISKDKKYIEIKGINKHINNIYMKVSTKGDTYTKFGITLSYTDDANKRYKTTPERTLSFTSDVDNIIDTKFVGKTKKLRININTSSKFYIESISFNKRYKYVYSLLRMIILFTIFTFIYFLKYNNIFNLDLTNKKSNKYILSMILTEIALVTAIFQINTYFLEENFKEVAPQRDQYKLLAEAFMHGHTYLDEEPSKLFDELSNPYDTNLRDKVFDDAGEEYLWDVAYFNNKYYVYFGVAPVIFYYLPVYALTGHHIKTSLCIYITGIITLIGIFILLKNIALKWFKDTKLGTYILLSLMFVNGCGLLLAFGRPDHYNLPILMGMMFSIYGLLSWIKASNTDKLKYYFLGSLSMALVAACRPQLLLTSFLCIPLFWDKVKEGITKDNIKRLLAIAIPYLIVAIPLMYYNYVRFDSPFDFGANYNLTTNDMTKRGWVMSRIPLGLFYYLINPMSIGLKFPFVYRAPVVTNYMGLTIYEQMCAGFLYTNILCVFAFTLFKKKDEFKDKVPYILGILLTIFALIIICVDTEMAGILPRYYLDFSFMFYIATFISVLSHNKQINNKPRIYKILKILLVIVIAYNVLFQLSEAMFNKSDIFFYLRYLFDIWV